MLATETFKVYQVFSPPIFNEVFCRRDVSYNLQSNSKFAVANAKSVFDRSESVSYLGPTIWDIVPSELKELTCVNAFKTSIKKRQPKDCPCRLYRLQYLSNLDFITNTSETCF